MSRQEEIREGVTEIIKQWIIHNYPVGSETFADLTKHIQEFEDSQGVVIKVTEETKAMGNDIMVKYNSYEPLIEKKVKV